MNTPITTLPITIEKGFYHFIVQKSLDVKRVEQMATFFLRSAGVTGDIEHLFPFEQHFEENGAIVITITKGQCPEAMHYTPTGLGHASQSMMTEDLLYFGRKICDDVDDIEDFIMEKETVLLITRSTMSSSYPLQDMEHVLLESLRPVKFRFTEKKVEAYDASYFHMASKLMEHGSYTDDVLDIDGRSYVFSTRMSLSEVLKDYPVGSKRQIKVINKCDGRTLADIRDVENVFLDREGLGSLAPWRLTVNYDPGVDGMGTATARIRLSESIGFFTGFVNYYQPTSFMVLDGDPLRENALNVNVKIYTLKGE